jgi:hypothetical protein
VEQCVHVMVAIHDMEKWLYLYVVHYRVCTPVYTLHETNVISGFVQQTMSFPFYVVTVTDILTVVSLTATRFEVLTVLCVSCFPTSYFANICNSLNIITFA